MQGCTSILGQMVCAACVPRSLFLRFPLVYFYSVATGGPRASPHPPPQTDKYNIISNAFVPSKSFVIIMVR